MSDKAGCKQSTRIPSVSLPAPSKAAHQEPARLMISDSRWGIRGMIHTFFKLGFTLVDAWSKPQQIPHRNRLMSVMTKYMQKPERVEGARFVKIEVVVV